MIHVQDKSQCCGCEACVQRCPVHCISMKADEEGFMYSEVDSSLCIQCGLCEKVCPVIGRSESREPISVWAAWNKNDEIRRQSSSGGIFTAIAESVTGRGGIVFGARFDDNWNVIHDSTETLEGLAAFRGSKYVQSRIGDCYIRAEQFLKQGRTVLFTGTPCQIAGLHGFLQKDYPNLLTVDIICHGVPSPEIWRKYLTETFGKYSDIASINFRDKITGWKNYSFTVVGKTVISEVHSKNSYMRGFIADLYLRPSCYSCPAKCLSSRSDITLGDFWGVDNLCPQFDDDKGISLLIVNSISGVHFLKTMANINLCPTEFSRVVKYNPSISASAILPPARNGFWEHIIKQKFSQAVAPYILDPFILRCKIFVHDILVKLRLR